MTQAVRNSELETKYVYFNEGNLDLHDFPEEVILHIFSFLYSPRDLLALSLTSRQFKRMANTPCLWLPFCHSHRYFHVGMPVEDAHLLYSRLERIESNVKENAFVVETTPLPSDAFYIEFSHNALCMSRAEGFEIYNLDSDTLERALKFDPPDSRVVKEINAITISANKILVDLYEQKITEYAAFLEIQKLIPRLQELLFSEFSFHSALCTVFCNFPADFDELQAIGGMESTKQSFQRLIELLTNYMSHQVGITGGVITWEKLDGIGSIEIEAHAFDINAFAACEKYFGIIFSDGFYEVWDRQTGKKIMSGQTASPFTAIYFFRDEWHLYDEEEGCVFEINLIESTSILRQGINFYKQLDASRAVWVFNNEKAVIFDTNQKKLIATYERAGALAEYCFDGLNGKWQAWSIENEESKRFLVIEDLVDFTPANPKVVPIPVYDSIEATHDFIWSVDLEGELSRLDPSSLEKVVIMPKSDYHFKMGWYREKLYIYHFSHGMIFLNFAANANEIESDIAAFNSEQRKDQFTMAGLVRSSASSKIIEKNGAKRRRLRSS